MRLALTLILALSLWSVASSRRSQDDNGQGHRNNRGGRGHNNRGDRGHNNRGGHGHNNQGGQGHNTRVGHGHNNRGGHGHNNQGGHGHNNQGGHGHNNRGGQGHRRPAAPAQDFYKLSEDVGGTCSPRDSCKELSRLRGTRTWNSRLCDCGPECIRFASCCADSLFAGKFPAHPAKNEECIQPEFFRTYYTMVSKCDDDSPWPKDVKDKCERKGYYLDGEPLARNIPVTSIGTLTTYRNFYCAVCNYGGDDLVGWEMEVKKMPQDAAMKKRIKSNAREYNMEHIVWDGGQKSFVIRDEGGRGHSFTFLFRIPAYLRTRTHNCHPELRQTCKPEFQEFQEVCHAYYSPIKADTKDKDRTYRNMHCAMCRGVDPQHLEKRQCQASTKGGDEDEDEESRSGKHLTVIDFDQYGDADKKHKYLHVPDCGRETKDPETQESCRKALCVTAKDKPCQ